MPWPTIVKGDTVTTRPGTFTAFSQPKPSPHSQEITTKQPIAATQEATMRATVAATCPGAQRCNGDATSGSAYAAKKAGCLIEAATPMTNAPTPVAQKQLDELGIRVLPPKA